MTINQTNPEKSKSRLSEILGCMTFDQLRYIAIRFEYATKKEAAEAIGLEPDTVYHWPKEVDEALYLIAIEAESAARSILKQNLIKAAMVKVSGLDSDDERIRQGSATEVLDRQLGKATLHQEVRLEDVRLTDEERAERILALLDAARARRVGRSADE